MKLKAIWLILTNPHWLILTPSKQLGVMPKNPKDMQLMTIVAEALRKMKGN